MTRSNRTTRAAMFSTTLRKTALLATWALGVSGALAGCGAAPEQDTPDTTTSYDAALVSARGIRFGVAPQWYQDYTPPSSGPANVDVVAVGNWLIQDGFTAAHKTKLNEILTAGKEPYFFGYIATSLTKQGLGDPNDCNGNTSATLCQQGADYIRAHIDSQIVPAYKTAAASIGAQVGSNETLIHVEPDWYQFSETAQHNPFTRAESNGFMNKILGAISTGCPSCKVVIDFSTWFSPSLTQWATSAGDFYAGWDRSVVKYVGVTGKPFPFTTGQIDNFTYGQISTQLGLPLVVIDAYTFGGGPIDIDSSWLNASNLAQAANAGVAMVLLSQQGDVTGYDNFIKTFRGSSAPPSPPPAPPSPPPTPPQSGSVSVTVTPSSTWNTGYCNNVVVANGSSSSATWTATIPAKGTIYNSWSSNLKISGSSWVFTGLSWNATLAPGANTTFGYCANN